MTIIITRKGYDKLSNELNELVHNERPKAYQMLEETRPIGVSDEFPPEYLQAIDFQNRIEKKISDLQDILRNSRIFEKTMICYNEKGNYKIGFGATVTFINTETEEIKRYTIVSTYESDISNGLISIQAPFVKEMIGLSLNDYFEYNDNEYEIINIQYSL